MEGPLQSIGGLRIDVDVEYEHHDGVPHRLLAAGPYLRCALHDSTPGAPGSRACERFRVAWQQHMLADDETAKTLLRVLPVSLLEYLREQTAKHAARLDVLLSPSTTSRERRRWHSVGWRAAPALAARYQAEKVEPGLAFTAMRYKVDPADVQAAVEDPRSKVGASLRRRGEDRPAVLNLGVRPTVTDDFPYEPFPEDVASG